MATPPKHFGKVDARRSARDVAIVMAAALVAWLAETWLPVLRQSGTSSAATVALVAGVLSAIRRWLSDTRSEGGTK